MLGDGSVHARVALAAIARDQQSTVSLAPGAQNVIPGIFRREVAQFVVRITRSPGINVDFPQRGGDLVRQVGVEQEANTQAASRRRSRVDSNSAACLI